MIPISNSYLEFSNDHTDNPKRPFRVYVDQGVNLKKLRALQSQGLVYLLQAATIEQQFKGVDKQGKAFTIGESMIGGMDMIADNNVNEVRAEFDSKSNNDFQHIYAAYLNHCEYFVTENPRDFIENGKRDRLEEEMKIKIRRTDELLSELKPKEWYRRNNHLREYWWAKQGNLLPWYSHWH